jgi:hypothetical protein
LSKSPRQQLMTWPLQAVVNSCWDARFRQVRCVGATILGPGDRVFGALSIAGLAWRLTADRLELLGPELAAAGPRIGAQLRPSNTSITAAGLTAIAGPAAFSGPAPRWPASEEGLWWADSLAPEHVGVRYAMIGRETDMHHRGAERERAGHL